VNRAAVREREREREIRALWADDREASQGMLAATLGNAVG